MSASSLGSGRARRGGRRGVTDGDGPRGAVCWSLTLKQVLEVGMGMG